MTCSTRRRTGRAPWLARSDRTGGRDGRPRRPDTTGQRAAPLVLELDERRASRRGRDGGVASPERLVLVGAEHEVAWMQQIALEAPGRRGRAPRRPSANAGSCGKIQERCCQGFSAASCSHRQTVVADVSVTPPLNDKLMQLSAAEATQRPAVAAGSSQATPTTSATCAEGNGAGDPRPAYTPVLKGAGQLPVGVHVPPGHSDMTDNATNASAARGPSAPRDCVGRQETCSRRRLFVANPSCSRRLSDYATE